MLLYVLPSHGEIDICCRKRLDNVVRQRNASMYKLTFTQVSNQETFFDSDLPEYCWSGVEIPGSRIRGLFGPRFLMDVSHTPLDC